PARHAPVDPALFADEARVSGCTCAGLRRLARRVTQIYDHVLAPSGIRITQFSLLFTLARSGAMAIGPLANVLDMDRTTLTRNLKPLIDARLVTLAPGKSDARQREAALTRAGRMRYEDAKKLWRRAQDDINRTLGTTQVASLHQLSDAMLDTLNQKPV
ncbi:MAG: MarR family winged helix-turn-helix transcriptional regulator, partial [Burkholderiaceae bacterium]